VDKIKNYTIAILAGLLALSLFTQPAQSAPAKSKEAKAVEYHFCLTARELNYYDYPYMEAHFKECARYRP
jgi:hypothetical protein